jgi:hypothetical protein
VLRQERDCRDSGKLSDQVSQYFDLFRTTPVNRDQYRVHRPLSYDAHRIRDGIPVHDCKAATAGGIDSRSLDR